MHRRRLAALLAIVAAILGITLVGRPFARGLSFVVRAADMQGVMRTLADAGVRRATERRIDIDVPLPAGGTMPGRLYSTAGRPRRMALLVPGFHPAGIDEPRLVALARELAASGVAVVTPDVPELSRFEITPAITDRIEAAALWLSREASNPQAAGDGRIGLLGMSFSGGFSVVAAGRASLRERVAYVLSIGGHDDLFRVLRYLCLGAAERPSRQLRLSSAPDGAEGTDQILARRPDDYGVAVLLLGVADRIVPRPQVDALRAAVRQSLARVGARARWPGRPPRRRAPAAESSPPGCRSRRQPCFVT